MYFEPPSLAAIAEQALSHDPSHPIYTYQRSCALLKLGCYEQGWVGFERRFEIGSMKPLAVPESLWDGSPLTGRTLLIVVEQGFGDILQFARFLPAAIERAQGRLIIECPPALKRLFAASFPEQTVVAVGEKIPPHDLKLSLLSLPHRLQVPASGIKIQAAYLQAPETTLDPGVLPSGHRLCVAINWAGRPQPYDRSCPFETILGLLEMPDIEYVSLQYGEEAKDIARYGCMALIKDLGSSLADFADVASALEHVDLVITIDTALAHLVGALGKPVWVLLTYYTDWRYPAGRDDCDWYPSMRLFRQPRPGDWAATIEAVRGALKSWLKSR